MACSQFPEGVTELSTAQVPRRVGEDPEPVPIPSAEGDPLVPPDRKERRLRIPKAQSRAGLPQPLYLESWGMETRKKWGSGARH